MTYSGLLFINQNKKMKPISAILATGAILFSFSCNSGSDSKTEDSTTADTTTVDTSAATVATKPEFAPFKIFIVQHRVKDFGRWKPVYLAHDSLRQAYGITHFRFGRGLDDSNMVYVIDRISDVQKAKELAASSVLKNAMTKAGVSGPPKFSYSEVVRSDTSTVEPRERVRITHKVKDWDIWLKFYDSAGTKTRGEHGLLDRAITRGVDDPNLVSVVFAISDLAKAKARLNSEELKKLLKDAGVEGKPQITYYRIVD
jgi:hypothetical protein